MNVDSDNDIARGQDIDADGESIDEESNVDHPHNNDTRMSSTARLHSVSSISSPIIASLIPYSSNRMPKTRYVIAYIHFFCLLGLIIL